MPLVAAFLVPGQPLHFLRPAEPPYSALVAGHAQAAQALAAARPDVLIVYSTQWIAVLDELWQLRPHVQGLHVDENWYEYGDLPFSLRIDTDLTAACIAATPAIGVRSKGVDYDGFPIDTGTIVATGFLDPTGSYPLVLAANNVYHDWSRTAELGALVAAQAEALGRRYAVLGVGGLSGGAYRHELELRDDALSSAGHDELNRRFLRTLEAGDAAALEAACPDYAAGARADMGMKHLAFVLGALGSGYRGGRTLGYGPHYGCGAAVFQFDC